MSTAAERLRARMFGGPKAEPYQPQTKLSLAVQEMVSLVSAHGGPIAMAISSSAAPVIRRLDGTPGEEKETAKQHQQLLTAIKHIVDAGLDSKTDLDGFKAVMQKQGAALKGMVTKSE